MKSEVLFHPQNMEIYVHCNIYQKLKKNERKKRGKIKMFLSLSSVPSLLAITSLDSGRLAGCCVFVWDMDLDARWATAHSTHSSVVRPLLLDVEQIDLGVDYSRGIFHNFWLASFHLPLSLFSVHLPLSNSHPYPAAALQDTAEGGPWVV